MPIAGCRNSLSKTLAPIIPYKYFHKQKGVSTFAQTLKSSLAFMAFGKVCFKLESKAN